MKNASYLKSTTNENTDSKRKKDRKGKNEKQKQPKRIKGTFKSYSAPILELLQLYKYCGVLGVPLFMCLKAKFGLQAPCHIPYGSEALGWCEKSPSF